MLKDRSALLRRDAGRGLTSRDIKLRPVRLGSMTEGVQFRPDYLIGRYTKPGRIWCDPRPNSLSPAVSGCQELLHALRKSTTCIHNH